MCTSMTLGCGAMADVLWISLACWWSYRCGRRAAIVERRLSDRSFHRRFEQ
jgi:hypothetical protein